jgi:hypothetical protein
VSAAKSLGVWGRAQSNRPIGQTKRHGPDWRARTNFVSRRQALIYGVIIMLFVASPAMASGVGGRARQGLNWHLGARVSVSPSIGYPYLYVRETITDDFGNDKFDGHEHLLTARLVFFFRSVRISSRPLENEFLRLPVISWTSST